MGLSGSIMQGSSLLMEVLDGMLHLRDARICEIDAGGTDGIANGIRSSMLGDSRTTGDIELLDALRCVISSCGGSAWWLCTGASGWDPHDPMEERMRGIADTVAKAWVASYIVANGTEDLVRSGAAKLNGFMQGSHKPFDDLFYSPFDSEENLSLFRKQMDWFMGICGDFGYDVMRACVSGVPVEDIVS
jgi:hypothetical protein